MAVAHSPVKTKSGRTVLPPYEELHKTLNRCVQALMSTVTSKITCSSIDEVEKFRLRVSNEWPPYILNYARVLQQLNESGARYEYKSLVEENHNIKKQTKHFLSKLKYIHFTFSGTCQDDLSLDGLSDLTALSKMTPRRREDIESQFQDSLIKASKMSRIAELDMQQKLIDIDAKEKTLEVERQATIATNKLEQSKLQQLTNDLTEDFVAQLPQHEEPFTKNQEGEHKFENRNSHVADSEIESLLGNLFTTPDSKFDQRAENSVFDHKPVRSPTVGRNCRFNLTPESRPFKPSVQHNSMDAASRYLILNDLKKSPSSPFKGEPHLFHGWWKSIHARMAPLELSAMDKIDVLEAHTV